MTPLTHSRGRIVDLEFDDRVLIGDIPYLVKKVAKGGMGLVFLLDQDSKNASERLGVHGLRVALKTILPEFLTRESEDMFRRELAVWAGFRHPNVVALNEILDGGPDGWVAAMDGCLGSLRDHLVRSKKLPHKQATDILGDILDGLAYAYNRDQVLHLDLKPENVLYNWDIGMMMRKKTGSDSEKWRFMLSDWGIASVKQEQLDKVIGLPRNGQMCVDTFNNMGTLVYMAPERFVKGNRSSIASDTFSLGLIYFEMLVGRLPYSFSDDPIEELLSGAYFRNAQSLLEQEAIPKAIQGVILHCIAPTSDERPRSYSMLRESVIAAYRSAYGLDEKHVLSDSVTEWMEQPMMREALLAMGREYAEKQANNLRAAGREQDARNVLKRFLETILQEYKNEPENPKWLMLFARTAIGLQQFEFAKNTIETIVKANETHSFLDLIQPYMALAAIYHELGVDPEKELRCYHQAVEAQAPPQCKHVSSVRMKAKAHMFAVYVAHRLMKSDLRDYHMAQARKLVPDVDLDNKAARIKFATEECD